MAQQEIKHLSKYDVSERDWETFQTLSRLVNTGALTHNVAMLMGSDHPTLQQKLTRELILPFLRLLAKDWHDNRYDERKQAACEFAVAIEADLHPYAHPMPTV